jgi:hypothetical protein
MVRILPSSLALKHLQQSIELFNRITVKSKWINAGEVEKNRMNRVFIGTAGFFYKDCWR